MNANKLFSEFSLKKIWDKLLQHDKAMNSTLLVLTSGNWLKQEDGTFKNTVSYSSFKETDKLTVDLYDDGTISEIALVEYEQYIDEFDIVNGALVATANTKPTQTMTIVVKGDFEFANAEVGNVEELFHSVSNGKTLLASAITDKGVETASDATFEVMANNIGNIETDVDLTILTSATAVASDITEGCTAWVNGELIVGTRPAPLKMLTGSFVPSGFWANLTLSTDIVFSEKFDTIPTVTVSWSFSKNGSHFKGSSVSNVTLTGCRITYWGDGDGSQGISGTCTWVARV